MPVYYMSLFKKLSKIIHMLEKCHKDCLKEGGIGKMDHMVKWYDITSQKL